MKSFINGIRVYAFSMLFICFTSFFSIACQKENKFGSSPTAGKSILFIGNSLTYSNDLPGIVTRLAKDKGIEVTTTMVAKPNYALEDHWNDGEIQQLIKDKKYDFVVIQQGPSSQADGRVMLMDYGERLKDLCATTNSKLAFFMVWPAQVNFHTFDGVIRNYSDAAAATGSLLCPVGIEWKKYFAETNDYSYYGPDSFHPSQKGSEVAAAIIVKTLFP